ncbi:MAG TPA: class I SAM-dependent methyltransferase [Candidatus Paceibacterota bacterium]|jgi:SAM-dependent methyltransferase
MSKDSSEQFTNPKLVEIYDVFNDLGEDGDFWIAEVKRLAPKTIIDLGCGTGLLTCDLAEKGYEMTGVEPAAPMLEVARRKPYAEKVKWIAGGYEKFEGLKADLVLLTSHVAQFFYEDSEWNKMLAASCKALNPGGHILFDSRQHLEKSFETWPTDASRRRKEDPAYGPIEWWCKLLDTDDKYARYELHYLFLNTGEEVVSTDRLVFRTEAELRNSLEGAGFSIEKVYGDWDGSPLTEASPEMLFLASR